MIAFKVLVTTCKALNGLDLCDLLIGSHRKFQVLTPFCRASVSSLLLLLNSGIPSVMKEELPKSLSHHLVENEPTLTFKVKRKTPVSINWFKWKRPASNCYNFP